MGCSEKAYTSISGADLQNLLMLGSEEELADFAEEREWTIRDGTVTFGGTEEKLQQLPSTQLIQENLAYAKVRTPPRRPAPQSTAHLSRNARTAVCTPQELERI